MPPLFGVQYTAAWEGYPPHMSQEDYKIFLRAKDQIFKDAEAVYYDVGLSGQVIEDQAIGKELREMWQRVTQKRIDVLVQTKAQWNIIEIRPRATSTAAGRLLQYKDLWLADPPDQKPIQLILLTDTPDPDLISLLKTIEIQLLTA